MHNAVNARARQQQGKAVTDFRYTRTRTFPPRFIASPAYRQQLTAEVDMLCDEQVNRVIDRLESLDLQSADLSGLEDMDWTGRIPTRDWPLRGILRQSTWLSRAEQEYDVEVRQ